MKRIIMPIWGSRISPVFDTAREFLIVEADDKRIVQRTMQSIPAEKVELPWSLVNIVLSWQPQLIVCGAISQPFIHAFEGAEVELFAWLTGEIEPVLSAILGERWTLNDFLMPGCLPYRSIGRCWRQQRGQGQIRGHGLRCGRSKGDDMPGRRRQ